MIPRTVLEGLSDLTQSSAAEELGTTRAAVRYWRREYGLPSAAERLYYDQGWLYEHYVRQGMTQLQMAGIAKCDVCSIVKWMGRHNIEVRTLSEIATRNAQWNGRRQRYEGDDIALRQRTRDAEDKLRQVRFTVEVLVPAWHEFLDELELGPVDRIRAEQMVAEFNQLQESVREAVYREDGHRIYTREDGHRESA